MYYKIYNPEAGKWVSLKTNRGRAVLRNYINNLNGGASLETPLAEVDASGSLLGGGSRRTPMQEMTGGSDSAGETKEETKEPDNAGSGPGAEEKESDNSPPPPPPPSQQSSNASSNAESNANPQENAVEGDGVNSEAAAAAATAAAAAAAANAAETKEIEKSAKSQMDDLKSARDALTEEEFDNEADRINALAELAKKEVELKRIQEKQTILYKKQQSISGDISKTEDSIVYKLMELGFIDPEEGGSHEKGWVPAVTMQSDGKTRKTLEDLYKDGILKTEVQGPNGAKENLPTKPDVFQDGGRVNAELQGGRVNAELQGGAEFKPKEVGSTEFKSVLQSVKEELSKLPELEQQLKEINGELTRSSKIGDNLQNKRHLNHYFTIQAQFKKNLQKEIRAQIQKANSKVVKPIERVLGVFGNEGFKKAVEEADKAIELDAQLQKTVAVDKVPLTQLNVFKPLNAPMDPKSDIVGVAYDIFRLYGKSVDFKLKVGVAALNLGNNLKEISNLGLLIQRVQMMGAGKSVLTDKIKEIKEKYGTDLYKTIVKKNSSDEYLTRSLFTPDEGSAATKGKGLQGLADNSTASINNYAMDFLKEDPIISAFYNDADPKLDPVAVANNMKAGISEIPVDENAFSSQDPADLKTALRTELNKSVRNLYASKNTTHFMHPITQAIQDLDALLKKESTARDRRRDALHGLEFWDKYNKAKRELSNNQSSIKYQEQEIQRLTEELNKAKAETANLEVAVRGPTSGSKTWTDIIEDVEKLHPAQSNGEFIKMLKTKTSAIRDDLIKIIGEIQTLDEENELENTLLSDTKQVTYEALRKPAANVDPQKNQTGTETLQINRKTYNDLRVKLQNNLQSIHNIIKGQGHGKLINGDTIKFQPSFEDKNPDDQVKGSEILWDELEQAVEKDEYDEHELKEILGEQLTYEVGVDVDQAIAEQTMKKLDIKDGNEAIDTVAKYLMNKYPDQWLQDVDSNGKEFYFNTSSNNSSYTRPKGVTTVSRDIWLQTIPKGLQPSNDTSAEEASKHLEYAADALKDASDAEQSLHKKEKKALQKVKAHLTNAAGVKTQ